MFAVQRQTKRLDMMKLREYATYYNDLANMGEISDPSNYYADPGTQLPGELSQEGSARQGERAGMD